MKQRAFTLIELLVVIAIIAILAAILFPVFAQAREKARAIACISNLKQIALATTQYEQDFDEKTPNGINPYGGGQGWASEIYPYLKSTGVFRCPDDPTSETYQGVTGNNTSYCYNSQVSLAAANPGVYVVPDSLTIAAYNSPSRTVLFCEIVNGADYDLTRGTQAATATQAWGDDYPNYFGGSPGGYGMGGAYDPSGGNSNGGTPGGQSYNMKYDTGYLRNANTGAALGDFKAATGRHTGGANYVMADSHAKFFRPSAVSGGTLNTVAGDCGKPGVAAATDCSDSTIAATFNVR